jgi:uncharacterized hydrophobic protein (TIGR00341 family)
MPDRFIEIVVPTEEAPRLRELLAYDEATRSWHEPSVGTAVFKLLVPAERVESVLDPLQAAFADSAAFRIVVLPVEAALPRKEVEADTPAKAAAEDETPAKVPARVSREELYEDLSGYAQVTRVHLCMVVLSTVVAAIGIARDSTAMLIGAMVIAPLLGPNMALALATTLGDAALAWRAVRTAGVGLLLAAIVAFLAGFIVEIDPASAEVVSRIEIGVGDLILALAAGIAGALAFTTAVPSTLVGVMVAVALLPPLVVFAMLLARGHLGQSLGALLVLIANVICINLAGVATFLFQGVSPRTWWEARRSKRVARVALGTWVLLLAAVAAIIVLSRLRQPGG